MKLDEILKLEEKNNQQKLDFELQKSRQKNKDETMSLCLNLICSQIALNSLALACYGNKEK